ncbi:MAG: DUF4326 domain-containing protein [Betaproteobacteria bacterium]|nr:DUF4326 domain-containing protein [Betaproteobacteria bacterium]
MKPQRIQLSRRKGWKMPENAVSVARPSHWGNCYAIGMPAPSWMAVATLESIEQVVAAHRHMILTMPGKVCEVRTFLHGKNLACWCPLDKPCHADVLLAIANA